MSIKNCIFVCRRGCEDLCVYVFIFGNIIHIVNIFTKDPKRLMIWNGCDLIFVFFYQIKIYFSLICCYLIFFSNLIIK